MEHTQENDAVVHWTIKQDEPMDIPATNLMAKFGSRAADGVVAGENLKLFIKETDDHLRVLRTVRSNKIEDGSVVRLALPGAQNLRHGLDACSREANSALSDDVFCGEFDKFVPVSLLHADGDLSTKRREFVLLLC